jgi:hypothetical protein
VLKLRDILDGTNGIGCALTKKPRRGNDGNCAVAAAGDASDPNGCRFQTTEKTGSYGNKVSNGVVGYDP